MITPHRGKLKRKRAESRDHKQAGALQNWSARQQAAQAEIDALLHKNADTTSKPLAQTGDRSREQLDPVLNNLDRERISSESSLDDGG